MDTTKSAPVQGGKVRRPRRPRTRPAGAGIRSKLNVTVGLSADVRLILSGMAVLLLLRYLIGQ